MTSPDIADIRAAATDHVLVLRTLKHFAVATKCWTWNPTLQEWLKDAYGMGTRFAVSRHSVFDIYGLAALIERTKRDPKAFIVRGELATGRTPGAQIARAYLKTPKRPDPDLIDVPRQWLMADIDGYQIPDGLDLVDDLDVLIERSIADLLPPEFHDVKAFWQLSSSAGFSRGMLKVHLWFWLDRPIETEVLKRWMQVNARGIDQSLFNPVQVHYTADPVIEGGPDPIPRRTGWVQGESDTVTLPNLDASELRGKVQQQRRDAASGAGISASQATTIHGALAALGDGEGLSGFHDPLRRAAWLYAAATPPFRRDAEGLKQQLREGIAAAPIDLRKRTGVADYLVDEYLDRLILGAFDKLPTGGGWEPCKSEHTLPTGDAGEARMRMRDAIRNFLEQPMTGQEPFSLTPTFSMPLFPLPRRGLVVAEVGLGKSEAALQEIAEFIKRERMFGRQHRVLYFIPEHRLGAELVRRARAIGISTATWHGREYTAPGADTPMCQDIESVRLAATIGADVASFVCGSTRSKDKPRCEFFASCTFQRQRGAAATADLVIAAHNLLWNELPTELITDAGLIVIDESFWQSALKESSISVETFSQDPIAHPVLTRDAFDVQITNAAATNDLHAIRAKAEAAFAKAADGYLHRSHVTDAGLTADECATAGKLEWQRQRDVLMWPGMPRVDRKAASEAAAINGQLPRMHAFWIALRDLIDGDADATGRVELVRQEKPTGTQRLALLNLRSEFSRNALARPILLLDATGDLDVVKHYLPTVELLTEERPAAPHVTIRQVVGPLSKTSLAKRPDLISELRDFVASKTGGEPALVITHLEFEKHFEDLPHVKVAHFGAIAGRDEWGKVRHLFTIGRPQPDPEQTRIIAAQLTGKPVPYADPSRATRGVLMADGSGVAVEVSRFDQPDAEAVRAAVTDAAIVQAVGRGRGINRTAGTPLDVWIMGNTVTPWPVAEIVRWQDVALGALSRMRARGLMLENARDMAAVYPDLFRSPKAAEHAKGREESPNALCKTNNKGNGDSSFGEVRYRPIGAGQKTRTAWITSGEPWSPKRLRERLESVLGPLAVFEVEAAGIAVAATDPAGFFMGELGGNGGADLHVLAEPAPFDPLPDVLPPADPEPPEAVPDVIAARAALADLSRRLELLRPPRMWGDSSDALRVDWWRQRCLALANREKEAA